ncbi:amino acid permease [Arthrobacter sp. TPD3018]|uniref:APC family permease n=1 Tax=Bacteria TaxID=2 RepID=UPI000D50B73B|nr:MULTISPECIES: APC family permease [Bacteria]PVE54430.1 amino acid permease [Sphingomonas sp. TPD3009]PVE54663.1 amino acid permease [Arthrobacter sp. TPD3018]PVE82751.1 amino acid permease [Sphingomonas melonis]
MADEVMIAKPCDGSAAARRPVRTPPPSTLLRTLDWRGAFWAISGVPAGVLLTMGGVSTVVGQASWAVWIVSVLIGFLQCFVYAEIAGLYPDKSGGASVYGAAAWIKYSKFVAPVSVWCNWLAWSPVLALGTGLAAGYVVTSLFPADAAMNTWHLTLLDLSSIKPGLTLRINTVAIIAAAFLLMTFLLQHQGAARAAGTQKVLALICLCPLVLVGLVPIVTGDLPSDHLFPLLPIVRDAAGHVGFGSWNAAGLTLLAAGLFGAGWSTYGFEGAVCYVREFKDPARDTYKAIISAGVLCLAIFTLVPLAFQASLGLSGMTNPAIYDGTGVALALASIVKGGVIVTNLFIAIFILALLLIVMSSMMGSSRTLYQASVDGWLPRYLSRVNRHGAPTAAMWTDLAFNLILLMMSDYFMVLMLSNVCYMIFIFLNLQAGWIHRIDRPHWPRPFRAPTWLLGVGAALGFFNLVLLGAGAEVWGPGTLRNGLLAAALILPVFVFRHYIQDGGRFPKPSQPDHARMDDRPRAGILPFAALALAAVVIAVSHHFSVLPR